MTSRTYQVASGQLLRQARGRARRRRCPAGFREGLGRGLPDSEGHSGAPRLGTPGGTGSCSKRWTVFAERQAIRMSGGSLTWPAPSTINFYEDWRTVEAVDDVERFVNKLEPLVWAE